MGPEGSSSPSAVTSSVAAEELSLSCNDRNMIVNKGRRQKCPGLRWTPIQQHKDLSVGQRAIHFDKAVEDAIRPSGREIL